MSRINLGLLHRHTQAVFRSDLGLVVASFLGAIWLGGQYLARGAVDMGNLITLSSFLMIFSIERAHGKETKAIHLKLDELLAAQVGASNRLINVEEESEEVLDLAHQALKELADQKHPHEKVSIEHTAFFDNNFAA